MTRGSYSEFDATELYCPKCKRAVPVRKRLLIVLPDGDKYDYFCSICGTSVGDKMDHQSDNFRILKK
ncbi:MAG: cytoplasmic protein [Deltaproteobacteria bacterium]|jgi:hypothetical protein|nr:cytoplasmic protein [Deltaproteobacteria bacterium]MBN2844725.1 cytoplasmic protein [Deltaproteobacteria bacterium]